MSDKLIQCHRCGDPVTNELGDNPICGACALASELNVKTLEAENAKLTKALEMAAKSLYKSTQSCPSDMFDWEHPATCDIECNTHRHVDDAWKCWLDWLMGAK